jgi:hypothetical protein
VNTTEQIITRSVADTSSRLDLWTHFVRTAGVRRMVEVGVYRGNFAAHLLAHCEGIEKYYMLDPWRHLDAWEKPANKTDDVFEQFLTETRSKTDFAAGKRVILRGKTTEVIEHIQDSELDFAYVDGDHTLKGIAIDLIRVFPKVRTGGWIGGDDFSQTVWQHRTAFEPTLVFPFAVYFAEAVGARIYALPESQFLIEKNSDRSFKFIDLVGHYGDVGLRNQFRPEKLLKLRLVEAMSGVVSAGRRVKRLMIGG